MICGGVLLLLSLGHGLAAGEEKWESFMEEVLAPAPVNVVCIVTNCARPMEGCILDNDCRSAIFCAQKCFNEWDKDTTNEKVHIQNCTTSVPSATRVRPMRT